MDRSELRNRGADEGQRDEPEAHARDAERACDADRRGGAEAGADEEQSDNQAPMRHLAAVLARPFVAHEEHDQREKRRNVKDKPDRAREPP